jgi:D-sedoheptulose 7-phosphate isomerase
MMQDAPKNLMDWDSHLELMQASLRALTVTDRFGTEITPGQGFQRWQEAACNIRRDGGCVFLVGNGASAAMASHFATDLAKNGGLRTQVFTDPSLITALGNDIRFEEVFSEPLGWYMKAGDMLVAISSSGNSPNVVRAVQVAQQKHGQVVTLSGFKKDNAIRQSGDINFYLPSSSYGQAETGHHAILHYWMDMVECDAK